MAGRPPSVIRIFAARTIAEAAAQATGCILPADGAAPVMLPSSLDGDDALVQALRQSMGSSGTASSVVVPDSPLRTAMRAIAGGRTAWRPVELIVPEGISDEVLLPAPVVAAGSLVYVTLVDSVARTGPFQLDLLSRFVHPRHHLRRLIDPDRAGRAAEVNLARIPDWCVVGCSVPLGFVGVTRDVVAAELLALSLAERFFDRQAEFASPWEDRVVQRATELELGARIPGYIGIEMSDHSTGVIREQAREIADIVRQRMGIVLPDRI
ncbi:MAG TPA: hypothetical protein VGR08_09870 [Thermomicrobiales bacterium]|nr:hypothetical protein [Thermomicrobiales bacterium]